MLQVFVFVPHAGTHAQPRSSMVHEHRGFGVPTHIIRVHHLPQIPYVTPRDPTESF